MHAAVSKHIDLSLIKVVLVGSPGFVAADFCKHMFEAAVRNDERVHVKHYYCMHDPCATLCITPVVIALKLRDKA